MATNPPETVGTQHGLAPTGNDLLDATLRISVRLHDAIALFDEANAHYEIAAQPGIAVFQLEAPDTLVHASGSPSHHLLAPLADLRTRHMAAVGRDGYDNSQVQALLLGLLYIVDDECATRLGLHQVRRRPAEIVALDEEAAKHDPSHLTPGDVALRIWTPLSAQHARESGINTAALELTFRASRSPRYTVPT